MIPVRNKGQREYCQPGTEMEATHQPGPFERADDMLSNAPGRGTRPRRGLDDRGDELTTRSGLSGGRRRPPRETDRGRRTRGGITSSRRRGAATAGLSGERRESAVDRRCATDPKDQGRIGRIPRGGEGREHVAAATEGRRHRPSRRAGAAHEPPPGAPAVSPNRQVRRGGTGVRGAGVARVWAAGSAAAAARPLVAWCAALLACATPRPGPPAVRRRCGLAERSAGGRARRPPALAAKGVCRRGTAPAPRTNSAEDEPPASAGSIAGRLVTAATRAPGGRRSDARARAPRDPDDPAGIALANRAAEDEEPNPTRGHPRGNSHAPPETPGGRRQDASWQRAAAVELPAWRRAPRRAVAAASQRPRTGAADLGAGPRHAGEAVAAPRAGRQERRARRRTHFCQRGRDRPAPRSAPARVDTRRHRGAAARRAAEAADRGATSDGDVARGGS